MIKYLQIDKNFEFQKLQAEVSALEENYWKQHYNTNDFSGNWTVLPLRSIGGNLENISAVQPGTGSKNLYDDTLLLQHCPYLKEVLNFFECEKTSARLMKLHAKGIIKEHADHDLSYEDGEVRLHIPVFTNQEVFFLLEDERVVMNVGECWYLNLSLKHAVRNEGETDRVHLVIDCIVNDWVNELFARKAIFKKEEETRNKQYSADEKKLMIVQLRMMNTNVSHKLADDLENEINL